MASRYSVLINLANNSLVLRQRVGPTYACLASAIYDEYIKFYDLINAR